MSENVRVSGLMVSIGAEDDAEEDRLHYNVGQVALMALAALIPALRIAEKSITGEADLVSGLDYADFYIAVNAVVEEMNGAGIDDDLGGVIHCIEELQKVVDKGRLAAASNRRRDINGAHTPEVPKLEDLSLSVRAYNCILANTKSMEELLSLTARQMLLWKMCGAVTVGEIAACLDSENVIHHMRDDWSRDLDRHYGKAAESLRRMKLMDTRLADSVSTKTGAKMC